MRKFCIVCGRECDTRRNCFVAKEDVKVRAEEQKPKKKERAA